MMRISEHEQGSQEWLRERLGLVTASNVSNLITPTGKPSTSAKAYVDQLIAEILMGEPEEQYESPAMRRGKELEPEARAWCELQREYDVDEVGLCIRDDLGAGASPDGLIDRAGGLEIKCPTSKVHVSYLREGKCPAAYIPQVQCCMWITYRPWWDFCSYHPLMPKLLVRVERDEKYITAMAAEVAKARELLDKNLKLIREKYA